MKKTKIIFWVTSGLIVLTQGIGELVAYLNGSAIVGISALGYPDYFVLFLVVAKLVGSVVIIIPQFSPRIKEWAYAGFGIDFVSAFFSIWVVNGFGFELLLPVIAFTILMLSYVSYHKIIKIENSSI